MGRSDSVSPLPQRHSLQEFEDPDELYDKALHPKKRQARQTQRSPVARSARNLDEAKDHVPKMEPVTTEDARGLLPDPSFPHLDFIGDKYWGHDDESKLQQEYKLSTMKMAKLCPNPGSEIKLWRVIIK